MSKRNRKSSQSQEVAPDTTVVLKPFNWGCQFTGPHVWDEEAVGQPFISPSNMPDVVYKGLIDDRFIGPKSMMQISDIELMQLVAKAKEAQASANKQEFKAMTEEVADEALKKGGAVKSLEGDFNEIPLNDLEAKVSD